MEFVDHTLLSKGASLVTQIITLTSFAALVDSLAKPEDKDAIARYISTKNEIKFREFEYSIIKSAINIFCNKSGSLSLLRIWLYTLVGAFIFVTAIVIGRSGLPVFGSNAEYSPEVWQMALIVCLIAPLTAYLSYPSDTLSLYITKRIFLKENRKLIHLPLYWLLDVFLSALVTVMPLGVMYFVSISLINTVFAEGELKFTLYPLIGATVISASLSLFVSAFQLIVIGYGWAARGTIGPLLAYIRFFRGSLNFENYPLAVTCFSLVTFFGVIRYLIFIFS